MGTGITWAELADQAATQYLEVSDDSKPQSWWLLRLEECFKDLWTQAHCGVRWDSSAGGSPKVSFDATTGQVTLYEDIYDIAILKVDGLTVNGYRPQQLEQLMGPGDWQTPTGVPRGWYRLSPFVLQLAPIGGAQIDLLGYYCPTDALDPQDRPGLWSPLHGGLKFGACYFAALNDHERDGDGTLKGHYSKLYLPYVLKARKYADSTGDAPQVPMDVEG